ncbi:copper resistance protein B [Stenotrophomonas sp. BIO128-Bstrain]|uniref:copper resistance protein B n=1 Tax=Stenotrophomonas TaxID=40323 RepID=UPI0024DE86BF|nr:copper resistance protein B [Stenotrophomonas sp. BIO128-Bstrain]WIA63530.1 copper resistance protein B [Stenotrophomonas sp. BIO128-Bstrain]
MATSALSTALLLALSAPAWAQSHAGHAATPTATTADTPPADGGNVDHSQMDHSKMDQGSTDHSQMDHSKMDHGSADHSQMDHSAMDHGTTDHGQMDHSKMDHAAMGHGVPKAPAPTEPLEPIPAVTAADRLAAFPPIDHGAMEHAPEIHSMLLVNRLERWDGQHGTGQAWEASGWVGGNINRLWLRSEGERGDGRTESANLEVMYGRSVSPWWDVLVGVKQDFRPADSRTWAAFGIQGLAPYKFETSATAYIGEGGQFAATVEVEYELLLTNRLILQPLVEATFSAKDEPAYGNGSGLNTVEAGLRLRYEFSRRFAPYIGISHERLFGDTADYHETAGERARDTRWVAGVRVWF